MWGNLAVISAHGTSQQTALVREASALTCLPLCYIKLFARAGFLQSEPAFTKKFLASYFNGNFPYPIRAVQLQPIKAALKKKMMLFSSQTYALFFQLFFALNSGKVSCLSFHAPLNTLSPGLFLHHSRKLFSCPGH